MKRFLIFASLAALVGCGSARSIDVDKVGPSMKDVIQIHDKYVSLDPMLTESQRAIYLTNSALVLEVIQAAEEEGTDGSP